MKEKPSSVLGFAEGMYFGIIQPHKKETFKVFDWNKAARYIKEKNIKNAEAGLQGDWNYTSGIIYENFSIPDESYAYLESSWAIPMLYDKDNDKMIECYIFSSDEKLNSEKWDNSTFWPDSAKNLLV